MIGASPLLIHGEICSLHYFTALFSAFWAIQDDEMLSVFMKKLFNYAALDDLLKIQRISKSMKF